MRLRGAGSPERRIVDDASREGVVLPVDIEPTLELLGLGGHPTTRQMDDLHRRSCAISKLAVARQQHAALHKGRLQQGAVV